LSSLARDLIQKMLIFDQLERIAIPEIRQHEWFRMHLLRHLPVPPPDTSQQSKMVGSLFHTISDYGMFIVKTS
jgi:5'-AMP-activated protein kinase, catalytic alpha subunit